MSEERIEKLSLSKAAEFLMDECRMVLPGIQTLLGFQLIVVFSPGFDQKLGDVEQRLHLGAIMLVAVAVAIIMAPAAYSRQIGPQLVTRSFVRISTRLLLLSMPPLGIGICLDCYLIASVIFPPVAVALTTVLAAAFVTLWFILPRSAAIQRLLGGDGS
jgi:Family of unknown function (DUF6328)